MAINKKLIHFKNKENFENEVANGNILDSSIVFIQDSKEISTHGTTYKTINWSVLELKIITFTIEGIEYQAEEGMTWEDWVNSEYNVDGASIFYDNTGTLSGVYGGPYNTLIQLSINNNVLPTDKIINDHNYFAGIED